MSGALRDCAPCRLEPLAAGRLHEIVALQCAGTAPGEDWPCRPGAVWRDARGDLAVFHFAPDRWLVAQAMRGAAADAAADTTADATSDAVLDRALGTFAAATVRVEVTGKWQGFRLSGPGAGRLLSAALAIEAVLQGRECAAVTLFDCPAVLARDAERAGAAHGTGAGYLVWVQASFAAHFQAVAGTQAPGLVAP